MSENLVCDKCGQRFNNQKELQKHAEQCAGKGAQQGAGSGPLTRGAGGASSSE